MRLSLGEKRIFDRWGSTIRILPELPTHSAKSSLRASASFVDGASTPAAFRTSVGIDAAGRATTARMSSESAVTVAAWNVSKLQATNTRSQEEENNQPPHPLKATEVTRLYGEGGTEERRDGGEDREGVSEWVVRKIGEESGTKVEKGKRERLKNRPTVNGGAAFPL